MAVSEARLEAVDALAPFALELEERGLVLHREGLRPTTLSPLSYPPQDLPPLEDHAGVWHSPDLDVDITLDATRTGLALSQHAPLLELPPFHAVGRELFLCDKGATLPFQRDGQGRPNRPRMDAICARGLEFVR